MKIAIDSFSFYKHFGRHWFEPSNPRDIRWYCRTCRSLGVEGLHIDPYHIDMDRDLGWVVDFARDNGMYVELGACGTTYDELIPFIEAAGEYNIKILRTFVGGSCLDDPKEIRSRVEAARKSLIEPIKAAEKADVKLAIENHGDIYIEDLVLLMEIDSENLGICYDSGNFAFTGEDPLEAAGILGNKIICTHLKDVCPGNRYPDAIPFKTVNEPVHFCAIGKGRLPFKRIIDVLVDVGLDKITLEICSSVIPGLNERKQLETEIKEVKDSLKYIREHGR